MTLNAFLCSHQREIISDWSSFARTLLPAAEGMSDAALNDHAAGILCVISQDRKTSQSQDDWLLESSRKTLPWSASQGAASIHGAERLAQGFSLAQMVSEFGALRASILRLWLPTVPALSTAITGELVRFNEAIDEAILQSLLTYTQLSDRTHELVPAPID